MKKRVLNLGAGTQSSWLLIEMDRGNIEPADVAVFADTGDETEDVYEHLAWLERRSSRVPIVRTSTGKLSDDALQYQKDHSSPDGRRFASIPLYVIGTDGTPANQVVKSVQNRQCTKYYKVFAVQDYIRREMLGLSKGDRVPTGVHVTQVFGISWDERTRVRLPTVRWQTFEYPLVEQKKRRWEVIELAEREFPDHYFPRSACYECPYRTNEEWRYMKEHLPRDWNRAVEFDYCARALDIAGGGGGVYVHKSRVPLDEADLRNDDHVNGQLSLTGMLNECEGMCGV